MSSIGTLYGISDEVHQLFVENRHAAVLDVIADFTGTCLGVFCYGMMHFRKK